MSREVAVTEKHKGREKVGDRKRERDANFRVLGYIYRAFYFLTLRLPGTIHMIQPIQKFVRFFPSVHDG